MNFGDLCLWSRWLLPGENRRPVQQKIPCGQETGLGTLLYSLALLGPAVRTVQCLQTGSKIVLSQVLNVVLVQEETLCGYEGGEERSTLY